jgi:hypothetical protein
MRAVDGKHRCVQHNAHDDGSRGRKIERNSAASRSQSAQRCPTDGDAASPRPRPAVHLFEGWGIPPRQTELICHGLTDRVEALQWRLDERLAELIEEAGVEVTDALQQDGRAVIEGDQRILTAVDLRRVCERVLH